MAGSVLARLQRLPRPLALLLGMALIAFIAWLDALTGPKLALNVFYLLPVMLVAWGTLALYSLPVALWNAGMRTRRSPRRVT